MWIRNKGGNVLFDVDNVYVEVTKKGFEITTYKENYSFVLGTYTSKEKALKVVDMIQERIIEEKVNLLHAIYQEPNHVKEKNMVFQMPEDDEVKEDV